MLYIVDIFTGTSKIDFCSYCPCFSIPESQDPEDVYLMLKRNFDRSYNGNTRAPFGLYVHAAWFFGADFRFS